MSKCLETIEVPGSHDVQSLSEEYRKVQLDGTLTVKCFMPPLTMVETLKCMH